MPRSASLAFLALLAACVGDDKGSLNVLNDPPSVLITSPGDGDSVLEGEVLTLRAQITDRETALSDVEVEWQVDGEVVCADSSAPDEAGETSCQTSVDRDATITVIVFDGDGGDDQDSVTVAVTANAAPEISLRSPVADQAYYADLPLALSATVSDAEDTVAELSVTWLSGDDELAPSGASIDSDGEYGASIYLGEGVHVLKARVEDTLGKTASDTVTITVYGENEVPVCEITGPADGAQFALGDMVELEGSCVDTETAPPLLLGTVESSADGEVVAEVTFDSSGDFSEPLSTLSAGTHKLVLTVEDDYGDQAVEFVTIEVCDDTWYTDADEDGFGDLDTAQIACEQPAGTVGNGEDCDDSDVFTFPGAAENESSTDCMTDADQDGYGAASPAADVTAGTDCDDTELSTSPAGTEVCDEVDNDCDGSTDEYVTTTFYADTDGDGYGDASSTTEDCSLPSGYANNSADCDDSDTAVNPAATEICDSAGTDEDCDGDVDDADSSLDTSTASTWYTDADGDSYGDASSSTLACAQPSGAVADSTDCDDDESAANPGETEICDSIDNDCDGDTDDADSSVDTSVGGTTYYTDSDGDGYGDASTGATTCTQPSGMVTDDTDCDDDESAANPGETEVCDNIDNDCDGDTDDADSSVDLSTASTWYTDSDGDGYGDASSSSLACAQPSGEVSDSTDCDDGDSGVNPGETEICDSLDTDEDCDGLADDADSGVDSSTMSTWYSDADGDGYGDASSSTASCDQPSGSVALDSDCDDTDAWSYPGAMELCDGQQNDCSDSSWSSDVGLASFYDDTAGTWSDETATLGAGISASPATITLSDAGQYNICEGTWYGMFEVEADVDMVGMDGADLVTLDAGGNGTVVTVLTDAITVGLSELTITGGEATQTPSFTTSGYFFGGGVHCSASSNLDLDGVVFTANNADVGGALLAESCDVTAANTTWSDNTATVSVSAVYTYGSTWVESDGLYQDNEAPAQGSRFYLSDVTFTDVTFDGNTATDGGSAAMMIGHSSTFDATGLTVSNNQTGTSASGGTYYGGAVWVYSGSTASFSDATFSGNTSDNLAGAMYIYASDVDCDACTFDSNTAVYAGGALYVRSGSTLDLTNGSVISNNTSDTYGGGLYVDYSDISFDDTTVSGNYAGINGGGAVFTGTSSLPSTIVSTDSSFDSNEAATRGGGFALVYSTFDGDNTDFTSNLAGDDGGAIWLGSSSILILDSSTVSSNEAADSGGGILNDSCTVSLSNTALSSNVAGTDGGAIYDASGDLTVDTCSFDDNTVGDSGGAIFLSSSTLDLDDSTFNDNSCVDDGGAIVATSSDLDIDSCDFEDNSSSGDDGGAIWTNYSTYTIDYSSFTGNSGSSGGALCDSNGTATNYVRNTTFTENTGVWGGAAYVSAGTRTYFQDTDFTDNSAGNGGGAVGAFSGAWLTLHRTDLDGNEATASGARGGAVMVYGSSEVNAKYATFTDNTAAYGGALYLYLSDLPSGSGNNTFTSNTASTYGGAIFLTSSTATVALDTYSSNSPDDTYNAGSGDSDTWGSSASYTCTTSSCN